MILSFREWLNEQRIDEKKEQEYIAIIRDEKGNEVEFERLPHKSLKGAMKFIAKLYSSYSIYSLKMIEEKWYSIDFHKTSDHVNKDSEKPDYAKPLSTFFKDMNVIDTVRDGVSYYIKNNGETKFFKEINK